MGQIKPETAIFRRDFIKDSALLGATTAALGGFAPARVLGANDRIRMGILGTGHRAQYVGKIFSLQPSVEIVAICDVYGPRRQEGLKLAVPIATATDDYRRVLDRKDIDAVLIGSPDHWHKQMLIDAVRAGKDAYCEKPVIHSLAEGPEEVKAVEESGRIVQTGTQQRSWPHYQLGKYIVDSGKLGKITFIHTYWYQNYHSRKGGSKLFNIDSSQLEWNKFLGDAPGQPFTAEKFVWWRFYWDFGGGILTDLLTHWIDVIQWYMNQPAPMTATTTGDLYLMNWQCPDTITTVYEYPGKFSVAFTGALNDSIDHGGIEFRGTHATLKIDRAHLAVYPEGVKPVPGSQYPEPEIFARAEHDGTIDHVKNFLDCVRTRKTPNAPITVGVEAARASWIGNIALKRGLKTVWDAAKGEVIS
ncbi:MAG: Gfo/Idh/MocA family oxidoreductase [Acidobacteria bacterium]|nr:Gfo/Idh/MocA family oxidoreductase [Acidobacteriota bacterium]